MTTNTHWTDTQRTRLRACIEAGDTIAYWCSDAFGRPSNGGNITIERAAPGVVHTAPGAELCAPGTLHATEQPHRWAGLRVWIVACRGVIGRQHDKLGCREREILGEILPEEAIEPSVAIRVGAGADLAGANLARAYLARANLARAIEIDDAEIPTVDKIDMKILAAIECGGLLDMSAWHGPDNNICGTTHCRAGWAVHLAGDAGIALQAKVGPQSAGAMIYRKSRPSQPAPWFFASNDDALADIRKCAAEQAKNADT